MSLAGKRDNLVLSDRSHRFIPLLSCRNSTGNLGTIVGLCMLIPGPFDDALGTSIVVGSGSQGVITEVSATSIVKSVTSGIFQ